MADLPILFSAPMVRAILRETERPGTGKTQTRRVLTADCDAPPAFICDGVITAYDENGRSYRWPNTKAVGDRLYVREAWQSDTNVNHLPPRDIPPGSPVWYPADDGSRFATEWSLRSLSKTRPGMFMPRWASRLTLTITDVRVQRLQEISEADALAEGIQHPWNKDFPYGIQVYEDGFALGYSAVQAFRALWNHINAARGCGWDKNPWVAAYTFTPVLGNIDQVRP